MKPDEIRRLYDRSYAASYGERFLHDPHSGPDAEYERALIESFLTPRARWLDVACGTGYFLSLFPATERTGLDLSPAMLEHARENNPGVELIEADFRSPMPRWENAFDLVSCMWYAYTLVDTIDDIERLVENLAAWTSPTGRCFLPVADSTLITGVELPFVKHTPALPGTVTITGILWSYSEDAETKVHRHMVVPAIPLLVDLFRRFFTDVTVIHPVVDGVSRRPALIATGKRDV